MKSVLAFLAIVLSMVIPVFAQQGRLVLVPAKMDQEARQLVLVAKESELIDADAAPMYNLAIKAIPKDIPEDKMKQWRNMPASQLPMAQAEAVLKQFAPAFILLEQAVSCKRCQWPSYDISQPMPSNLASLSEYRKLAFGLALRTRVAIVKRNYEEAVDLIRAGFRMAQQVGDTDVTVQQLVAVAIGSLMCREIEQLVQSPGSPSLYWAFESLPIPLVDMERCIKAEISITKKKYNALLSNTMLKQAQSAHKRIRLLGSRLSRHIASLQCVEAMRLYATETGGLPIKLADINKLAVPDDPVEKKPFKYSSTGTTAVLETPIPEGGTERDAVHYEITFRK